MRPCLAVAVAVACMGTAFADVGAGANAGIVTDTEGHRIELVVKPYPKVTETTIVVFVTDRAGHPISTQYATGRATFSSGGLKGVATLHPDGANRMKGYGLMSARRDLLIEVSISFPEQAPLQARFEPLANEVPQSPPR